MLDPTNPGTEGNQSAEETETITPEEAKRLRDVNQRLQGKLTDTEKQFGDYKSIYKDIDPVEARQAKEDKAKLERELAKNDPQKLEELHNKKTDVLRRQMDDEKKALEDRLGKLEAQNRELAVTDRVMTKISSKFTDDGLSLIKREAREAAELDDDGALIFKDEQGEILYSPKNRSLPMTTEEYGDYLVDKYPSLARSTVASGTKDATPGQKTNGRLKAVPTTLAELNSLPNSREVFERLKREDPAALQKLLRSTNL